MTEAKPAKEVGDSRLTAYANTYSSALPSGIPEYHAHFASDPRANMMTTDFQSKFQLLLANSIGAKRVLDIGVFVGYSAYVFSHAVGPDGLVTGLEINPEYAKTATEALAERGVTNVEILLGSADETLPTLKPTTPYDLVFIDAFKDGYLGYIDYLLKASPPGSTTRLLRPGALILIDNVLWRGLVAPGGTEQHRHDEDRQTVDTLRAVNERVRNEPRLQAFLVPLFDGLNVARLVD